jgi:hypothetical protein
MKRSELFCESGFGAPAGKALQFMLEKRPGERFA